MSLQADTAAQLIAKVQYLARRFPVCRLLSPHPLHRAQIRRDREELASQTSKLTQDVLSLQAQLREAEGASRRVVRDSERARARRGACHAFTRAPARARNVSASHACAAGGA